MTPNDDRSVPAFGALALLVLMGVLGYGLFNVFAALYAFLHDLTMVDASTRVSRDLSMLTLVQLLAMGTSLVVGLKLFDPDTPPAEGLSLRPVKPETLAVCLAAGALLQFPLSELGNVLHAYVFGPDPLEKQLSRTNMLEAHTLGQGVLVIVCLAAIVPLIEELLFRGLFLFGLARRYGNGFALMASASFFGVSHIEPVPAVYATVAGLLIGTLALATRSVWPGIAVHAALNAVPILVPERVLPIHGFNVPSALAVHMSPWLVWPPLAVGLALLAVAHRIEYLSRA